MFNECIQSAIQVRWNTRGRDSKTWYERWQALRVLWALTAEACGGPVAGRHSRATASSRRHGGGGASPGCGLQHCQGGLAAEAWRAHSQLARPLLHPVYQRRLGGLQVAARAKQLPRTTQQVHGARLPDYGRGQTAPLHLHYPRPTVDHRHWAQFFRRHWEGAVSMTYWHLK